jgi:uncharacterized protein (TIGR03083 family)
MDQHLLDRAATDAAVGVERLAVADLVADLDREQLATPSLCAAWPVRDVVAHLCGTTRVGLGGVLVGAIRARGSFDRMEIDLAARRAAAHTDEELVAQLRASATSNRRTPFSSPMDPLMDVVVHAQDIGRPLGVDHAPPPAVVAAVLTYVVGNRFLGGPKRVAGVGLVATDLDWSAGVGDEVSGPALDLLLAAAGRRAGLATLSGPGLDRLAAQL